MRCPWKAISAIGLLVSVASATSAQSWKDRLGEPGFFGPNFMRSIQGVIPPNNDSISDKKWSVKFPGDKNHAMTWHGPGGFTISVFTIQSDTLVLLSNQGPTDLGGDVIAPSGAFVLQQFAAIISRKDQNLTAGDFPPEFTAQLQSLWRAPATIKLTANTMLVRGVPAGDALDELRGFLKVDRVTGTTVVAFEKGKTRMSTGLYLFGSVAQPFGIDGTLTDPSMTYTKGAGPNPTIAVASILDIKDHRYDFKAQGSKIKDPDILALTTVSLSPQNLADISRALSKPLWGVLPGAVQPLRFDLVPTISLRAPNKSQIPANLPKSDSVQVIGVKNGASNSDWNMKGPMVKVAGALHLDLVANKQDIAFAIVDMKFDANDPSAAHGDAAFSFGGFNLPGSQLSFGEAAATIGVSPTSGSFKIVADTKNDCFRQKMGFTVSTKGLPTLDPNFKGVAQQLTPSGFYANLKGCAKDAKQLALWAWNVSTTVYGFATDQILKASSPILGPKATGYAAKAANVPVEVVGKALGALTSKDDLLDMGREVWGDSKVADLANAAGYGAEDIFHWCWARHYSLNDAGTLVHVAFWKDPLLLGARAVYKPSNEDLAKMSKAAGFTARETLDWFARYQKDLSEKEVLTVLGHANYAKDQVKDAAMTAYNWSSKKFEDWFAGACKVVFGWTTLC